MMAYREGKEGEKRPVPFVGVQLVGCCDCGLVHRYTYTVEDKKIMQTVSRDNRATAGLRRAMAKRGEIMREDGSNVYVILRRIQRKRTTKPLNVKYEPAG